MFIYSLCYILYNRAIFGQKEGKSIKRLQDDSDSDEEEPAKKKQLITDTEKPTDILSSDVCSLLISIGIQVAKWSKVNAHTHCLGLSPISSDPSLNVILLAEGKWFSLGTPGFLIQELPSSQYK